MKGFVYYTKKFGFYFTSGKGPSKGNLNCQNIKINLKQTLNPSYRTHKNHQDEGIPKKYSDQHFIF